MRVHIPRPLQSYTDGREQVEGKGVSLAELLEDLDSRYPGMRFRVIDEQERIRTHIKFFVGQEMARELSHPILPHQEVHIICALSGG